MKSLLPILSLIFAPLVFASAGKPTNLQDFIDRFESKTQELQGGVIAILHKDKVIYKNTFGYQKGKTGAITSQTLFPLASVSKPVAAVAVALMAEKGRLDFNKKYKISCLKNEVSLTHILSHTTGYSFSGNTQIEQGMSRQTLLTKLKEQKPNCKAGQCYLYSNTTYSLVEEALNTQGESLRAAMGQLRAALNTNGIQIVPISSATSFAYPHKKESTKKNKTIKTLPFPPFYPKVVPAAAGVFGSLDGMIEFYKLSFGYRADLLSQKMRSTLYAPIIANRDIDKWSINWPCNRSQIDSFYGLGWRILKAKQNPDKELIFHGGMIAGAVSFIGYIPAEELGIIILANQNTSVPLQSGIDFWGRYIKN